MLALPFPVPRCRCSLPALLWVSAGFTGRAGSLKSCQLQFWDAGTCLLRPEPSPAACLLGLALIWDLERDKTFTAHRSPPLMSRFLLLQRLKASLTASSSLNGSNLVVGSASTMVTARPEQSQILVQHPDAPSPAQPQVCCCSADVLGGSGLQGKRRKTLRLPGFQNGLKTLGFFSLPLQH